MHICISNMIDIQGVFAKKIAGIYRLPNNLPGRARAHDSTESFSAVYLHALNTFVLQMVAINGAQGKDHAIWWTFDMYTS